MLLTVKQKICGRFLYNEFLLPNKLGDTCGGIPDHIFPNNHAGYGRIWVPAAINSIPQSP